ncbi:CPBP family intramembrane glutamic endopeptidase [Mesorhizobium sp. CAU 1741]|uniref:CPBP family intramembrane glutamic endopeptidase n=1 Tax=Mesorhizobium sp. CAU 1741 TaxID=3140366 RepID=UPI00325A8F0D
MNTRIIISLIVYALWIVVTLLGAKILLGGAEVPLDEMVKNGIGWQFVAAIVLLVAFILARKWNDLAFGPPHSVLKVMWFPVAWLLLIFSVTLLTGLPPASMIVFIAFNTLLVGISEETMFRGVLFRAFVTQYRIWTAIIVSSVLFGAVHILNVFNTGDLNGALMQSVPAAMSGILFVAIVIRTESIWPAIIYHWLWDCVLFILLTGSQASGVDANPAALEGLGSAKDFLPIAMGLPNFICGLILLRKVRDESFREAEARRMSEAA